MPPAGFGMEPSAAGAFSMIIIKTKNVKVR
jgi:hypothetical protein